MHAVCDGLPEVPEFERGLAVCLHWTFLQHALPGSPSLEVARSFAQQHDLLQMAEEFADRFIAVADSKEEVVRLIFDTFPEIPKARAALEYINSVTGTRQQPIP